MSKKRKYEEMNNPPGDINTNHQFKQEFSDNTLHDQTIIKKYFKSIDQKDLKSTEDLINNNPSIIFCNNITGQSGLHRAAIFNNLEAAKLLLDRGLHVDTSRSSGIIGLTSINTCALLGHDEMIKLLLERGGDPNNIVRGKVTPLKDAISNIPHNDNCIKTAETLIKYGAKVSKNDYLQLKTLQQTKLVNLANGSLILENLFKSTQNRDKTVKQIMNIIQSHFNDKSFSNGEIIEHCNLYKNLFNIFGKERLTKATDEKQVTSLISLLQQNLAKFGLLDLVISKSNIDIFQMMIKGSTFDNFIDLNLSNSTVSSVLSLKTIIIIKICYNESYKKTCNQQQLSILPEELINQINSLKTLQQPNVFKEGTEEHDDSRQISSEQQTNLAGLNQPYIPDIDQID